MDPITLLGLGFGLTGLNMVGNAATVSSQNKANIQSLREQYRLNKQLADHQFDQNIYAWNLNNRYNSPEQQMERMKSAGLNPALMYGQISPGSASPVTYQQPQVDAPKLQGTKYDFVPDLSVLSQFQDYEYKSAQVDTQKSMANYYDALAKKADADAVSLGPWRESMIFANDSLVRSRDFGVERGRSLLEFERQAARLNNELISGKISLIDWDRDYRSAQTRYLHAQANREEQLLPFITEKYGFENKQLKFSYEKMLPIAYLIKKEQLRNLALENDWSEQTFQTRMDKLDQEYRYVFGKNKLIDQERGLNDLYYEIAEIEKEILGYKRDNWKGYGMEVDPNTLNRFKLLDFLAKFEAPIGGKVYRRR